MTEEQLRALVRDAVARHLGSPDLTQSRRDAGVTAARPMPQALPPHASQHQYLALVNVGDACLIESAVECNHCGYCRSHGH